MGACTSKIRKYHSNDLKNDSSAAQHANKKKKKKKNEENSVPTATSSSHVDQFANVPFIDSEEKCRTPSPPIDDNDRDEQTTVKNNFESNVSYSPAETIEKLKREVLTFLREKILSIDEEKLKLNEFVLKRIIGNPTEKQRIAEYLTELFDDIEKHQPIDQENNNNQIKNRLMHIITIYVASKSSENSFLKALYDKMGTSLDLNSLNAETTEHEHVQVTVTKRVRQVYLDENSSMNSPTNQTIIQFSSNNGQQTIPADLPEDLRRKAEEVLHNLNDVLQSKH